MSERSAATEGEVVDMAAARAARTRALLSGARPVSDVLARAGSPGVDTLRVDQLITTYLPGGRHSDRPRSWRCWAFRRTAWWVI